ncbi:MAG: hypothetical protein NDJ94_00210 [Vicinamibacteria bacterium]|nr:hypothetical protein [Vicinamibacteria bacterium]
MILPLLLAFAALPPRPFTEERQLLDRRLAALSRALPDGPTGQADAAHARDLLLAAGLTAADAVARPPREAGATGEVLVDVTALGLYVEVDRFFRQALLSPRLVDVVSLTLQATPDERVKLDAVLAFPYRPAKAPLPAPPGDMRARVTGVPRATADQYLRDQALVLAKAEQAATLRRARRNPRLFLAELAAIVRDRPVTLTFAQVADDFVVRGLAAGLGPVIGLERRFERGFFRMNQFMAVREGACQRFEARGRAPIAGPDADLPLPAEDAFRQDEAPCRLERDSGSLGSAKAPAGGKPGTGPLTLRLRDVDAADVFGALHAISGQAFVVDEAVAGHVSVEFQKVTLDEALAALAKLGLHISPPGPIRRVSVGKSVAVPAAGGGGATGSFALKRANVRDLLALMTDLDETLASLGPDGGLGRVSVFARDVALGDLRQAVLESAGLRETIEEGRRLLAREGEAAGAVPVAASGSLARLVPAPQDLSVAEIAVAGLGGAGGTFLAFAYSPAGTLLVYRAGDLLADGAVRGVESTDAVLDTEDGPLRMRLNPMR